MTLASLIPFPVVLTQCRLPSRLLLLGAEIPLLNLEGSRVGALEADVLRTKGTCTFGTDSKPAAASHWTAHRLEET